MKKLILLLLFFPLFSFGQETDTRVKVLSKIKLGNSDLISVKYDYGAADQNFIASAFEGALFENGFSIISYPSDGSTHVPVKDAVSIFRKEYKSIEDKKVFILAFEWSGYQGGKIESLNGRLIDVSNNKIVLTIEYNTLKSGRSSYHKSIIEASDACSLMIEMVKQKT
tara:strand:+ start:426 stop:929 length:504 start_codon:yes stop_codon:yes gene_type:complete